jgi:phosphotransferase system IIB component
VHSKSEDCKAKHCMTRLKFEDTKVHSKSEDCKAKHCTTRLQPCHTMLTLQSSDLECTLVSSNFNLYYNVSLCNLLTWSAPWFPQLEDTKVHSKSEDCKAKHCMTRLKFEDTKEHSKSEDCKVEHCMTRLKFEDTKVHSKSEDCKVEH